MIVICEECGKKYQIDPSRIKGSGAKVKCPACGNIMHISKPATKPVDKGPPGWPPEQPLAAIRPEPAHEPEKKDFNNDEVFRKIAVQKVGLTGYTALHAVPDKDGIWRNWGHTNPNIVAIDMSTLKGPMGVNFPGFWKVFSAGKDGKESSGYYTWQEKDRSFRDKYMVCTPVTGTPYYIAATTYLDEFTKPVQAMEARAKEISTRTRNTVFGILGGTLILIGLVVALYGRLLTSRIRSLTDVAERISVGDMDAEIKVTSKDELGDLAEAIGRMQESIRLSIERLRRRR